VPADVWAFSDKAAGVALASDQTLEIRTAALLADVANAHGVEMCGRVDGDKLRQAAALIMEVTGQGEHQIQAEITAAKGVEDFCRAEGENLRQKVALLVTVMSEAKRHLQICNDNVLSISMSHNDPPAILACAVAPQPTPLAKFPISQPLHSKSSPVLQLDSAVTLAQTSEMTSALAKLEIAQSAHDVLNAGYATCTCDDFACTHLTELNNAMQQVNVCREAVANLKSHGKPDDAVVNHRVSSPTSPSPGNAQTLPVPGARDSAAYKESWWLLPPHWPLHQAHPHSQTRTFYKLCRVSFKSRTCNMRKVRARPPQSVSRFPCKIRWKCPTLARA